MSDRRVGLWLIGALGGVASTVAYGLAALRRGLADTTALVTALPAFDSLDLDGLAQFVVGGHDIRSGSLAASVQALSRGANVFDPTTIEACAADLDEWSENVRPGTLFNCGPTIAGLADRRDLPRADTPRAAIDCLQSDIRAFASRHNLADVVVVNVASTEPGCTPRPEHADLVRLRDALAGGDDGVLPVSSLYAFAALELGLPYVNFTPSTGATMPALLELADRQRVPVAGQDGKTGETLLKTVLAPMFARRNIRVLSWVGHNILGNRDGLVLGDPDNKATKVRAKDQVVGEIVGYSPQTHTSIEYIESLDDWKTAWDHIHFRGFLGVKMTMQVTWQGCDSVLAAPLVIDLARLTLDAKRRKRSGVQTQLSCFFKNPMGDAEFDFFRQCARLDDYLRKVSAT